MWDPTTHMSHIHTNTKPTNKSIKTKITKECTIFNQNISSSKTAEKFYKLVFTWPWVKKIKKGPIPEI